MSELPFANGSEFEFWLSRNCYRCANYVPWDEDNPESEPCPIEDALCLFSLTGKISPVILERMGYHGEVHAGPCREWTPDEQATREAAMRATLPLFPKETSDDEQD